MCDRSVCPPCLQRPGRGDAGLEDRAARCRGAQALRGGLQRDPGAASTPARPLVQTGRLLFSQPHPGPAGQGLLPCAPLASKATVTLARVGSLDSGQWCYHLQTLSRAQRLGRIRCFSKCYWGGANEPVSPAGKWLQVSTSLRSKTAPNMCILSWRSPASFLREKAGSCGGWAGWVDSEGSSEAGGRDGGNP